MTSHLLWISPRSCHGMGIEIVYCDQFWFYYDHWGFSPTNKSI